MLILGLLGVTVEASKTASDAEGETNDEEQEDASAEVAQMEQDTLDGSVELSNRHYSHGLAAFYYHFNIFSRL